MGKQVPVLPETVVNQIQLWAQVPGVVLPHPTSTHVLRAHPSCPAFPLSTRSSRSSPLQNQRVKTSRQILLTPTPSCHLIFSYPAHHFPSATSLVQERNRLQADPARVYDDFRCMSRLKTFIYAPAVDFPVDTYACDSSLEEFDAIVRYAQDCGVHLWSKRVPDEVGKASDTPFSYFLMMLHSHILPLDHVNNKHPLHRYYPLPRRTQRIVRSLQRQPHCSHRTDRSRCRTLTTTRSSHRTYQKQLPASTATGTIQSLHRPQASSAANVLTTCLISQG
jgi:hypothetical protein